MKYILSVFLLALLFPLTVFAEVRVSISGGEKIESTGYIQVKIPFDQEYRINLDNKDSSRRALVHVKIDGRQATGDGLILRKGESVQLERFIGDDLKRGPKFKFVDNDEQKRVGRADSKEDGLIAVTVQYEKDQEPIVRYSDELRIYWNNGMLRYDGSTWIPTTDTTTADTITGPIIDHTGVTVQWPTAYNSPLEPGVTIEGSESKQRFQKTELGELEDRIETLVIRLLGYYKEKPLLMRSR